MRAWELLPWVLAKRVRTLTARRDALEQDNAVLADMLAKSSAKGMDLITADRQRASEIVGLHAEIEALKSVAHDLRTLLEQLERDMVMQADETRETQSIADGAAQRLTLVEYQNLALCEDLDRVERYGRAVEAQLAGMAHEKSLLLREFGTLEDEARRETTLWSETAAEAAMAEDAIRVKFALDPSSL